MDKFTAAGASVIGVSLDSIERLNDFSADPEYCAGKLAVASDPTGAISGSFDIEVKDGGDGWGIRVASISTTVMPNVRHSSSHPMAKSSRRSVVSHRWRTCRNRSKQYSVVRSNARGLKVCPG
jgi:peroxiredoxin